MKNSLLIIIICLTANIVFAQSNYFPRENYQINLIEMIDLDIYQPLVFAANSSSIMASSKNIYSYDDLAVFCKIEVKMEKASGFPVKFRLGEVNYVEKLEGKPYSIFY
jgi:hypothetical protein